MSKRVQSISIQVISILGFCLSVYLYISHLSSSFFCPVGDCLKVNSSSYAQIKGIPISVLGILYYLLLHIFTYFGKKVYVIKLIKYWLLVGLAFSLYLTYLELFEIKAICIWCVVSFGLIIVGNIIVFCDSKKEIVDNKRYS
ncbi:vitamin K epoxide reductase family protein [Bacillus paramycoides]|uniref:vitamin K epoxide reductase family protein n=1 Tax=Bacillus paramycoides TaxID=2026194 RepID=UPI0008FDE4DF|nr:vitamin K epoxide reductase family protein [Bacillus paramycoides]